MRSLRWILYGLLAFPVIDFILSIYLLMTYGMPIFLGLLCSAVLGIYLWRNQARQGGESLIQSMAQNGVAGVWQNARMWIVAGLFVFPGVLSDVLALALWLPIWGQKKRIGHTHASGSPASDAGIIDGEFREVPSRTPR